MSPAPSDADSAARLYHDVYDFSIFPVALGDILTWCVKSALRAQAAGRDQVHVHVVCDPGMAEFNPLQATTYLIDLLAVEALPAFYAHPLFAGVSLHRSRRAFREAFQPVVREDAAARQVFEMSEEYYRQRGDYKRVLAHFRSCCSEHGDINAAHASTGQYPLLGSLRDCLVDWRALQSQFAPQTFWVTVQFRLRRLDTGMPVNSHEGLERDAAFSAWFDFMSEAAVKFPAVRFVVVGRVQEKPLELLRLPNVVTLRPLGMNLGHEITALLHSDIFLGSASGFAQAAHFSELPYDVFNCTAAGCQNYGIPFGTPRLPIAVARQRLHYGAETPALLLDCLHDAWEQRPRREEIPAEMETGRTRSTDRFFFHPQQNEAELVNVLSGRVRGIALTIERGDYRQARADVDELVGSFPAAAEWQDVRLLVRGLDSGGATPSTGAVREDLLAEISSLVHPHRLVCWSGRYFDNLTISEGFRRDGWCEREALLVFVPSRAGDIVYLRIRRLAGDQPTALSVQVNDEAAMPFVLVNEPASLEVPVRTRSIPTRVRLIANHAEKLNAKDDKAYSYQLEAAGVSSRRGPVPAIFRADKKSPREKVVSGIFADGMASSLARIRVDNPHPAGMAVMVHLAGMLPRGRRHGQKMRVQINDDPALEAVVTGKRFQATLPCVGTPRHLSVMLRFWDIDGDEEAADQKRALVQLIEVVPATGAHAEIRSGAATALDYLWRSVRKRLGGKSKASP